MKDLRKPKTASAHSLFSPLSQGEMGVSVVIWKQAFAVACTFFLAIAATIAQPASPPDTTRPLAVPDTVGADSLRVSFGNPSGIDTVLTYTADNIVFDVQSKKFLLYGNAAVTKGQQKLTAYYIEIDQDKSTLYAEARFDSVRKEYVDVPVFKDGSEEFSARTITYNLRTKRGTLGAAELAISDGFAYGEKIKRVSENTAFIKNGFYTTCDAPQPHYLISSPKMKLVKDDRVFAETPTLNIEGVPILPIPLGLFFPDKGGRQSGIIIPSWSQSQARGFTIERLGYYWTGGPFSDYFDTRLEGNLYSKGGFTFYDYSRFRYRGYIDVLDINPTYGQTRDDPDDPLTESFILSINTTMGQQLIGRKSQLGGYLNFSSSNAIRNTAPPGASRSGFLQDITTQEITSNFSYSTSFDWGGTFSLSYSRNQNIITDRLTETLPSATLSLPSWTPFATTTGEGGFLETFSIGGSMSGQRTFSRSDTIPGTGGLRITDTRQAINLNPTIGFSPKFGYFTFQPSFTTNGNLYFRRIHKQADGDTVITIETPGYFLNAGYTAGASMSTRLYGLAQFGSPIIFGITAVRHILAPTIGFTYVPDLGNRFSDEFFNPRTNRIERYSVFEKDGGGFRARSMNASFGISNTFEAKVAQGDTLEDKKVQLLQLNLSSGYDFDPDAEFRWNLISLTANTDLGPVGNLTANMTFDPYAADSLGIRIPELLTDRGEGLVRTTNIGVNFSTSFSDEGFNTGGQAPTVPADSVLGRRARFDFHEREFSQQRFFGEQVEGQQDFRIPWQASFNGSYNMTPKPEGGFNIYASLNTSFSFSLTPTIKLSSSASYNFRDHEFQIPEISLYKDLHCWEMSFNWYPGGFRSGFFFRLNVKAPQLQDLKLERTGY
jgi:hypothetical protein